MRGLVVIDGGHSCISCVAYLVRKGPDVEIVQINDPGVCIWMEDVQIAPHASGLYRPMRRSA